MVVQIGRLDIMTAREAWIGGVLRARLDAGSNSNGGLLRHAVLGLSHHGQPEDERPSFTSDVVRDLAFEPSRSSAFFTKVARMMTGRPTWQLDRRAAWAEFGFANYVDALLSEARVAPSASDFAHARRTFVSKLKQLQPAILMVLGKATWDNLPDDFGVAVPEFAFGDGIPITDAWLYPWASDGGIEMTLAVSVPHPSGSAWRSEVAFERFQTARLCYSNVVSRFSDEHNLVL